MEWATEKAEDPIELRIYPGADGDFVLYEDENDGYAYEKGAHATIAMHWDEGAKTLTIGAREGSFPGMLKERTFKVVVGTGAGKAVRYLGEKVVVGEAVN
jgi:alpha-D-xyloside xylohydrolase